MSIRQVRVNNKAVTVNLEDKEVVPSGEVQEIVPSTGCSGLSSVTVAAVTSTVDADIKPENIRTGIEILGVTGEYTGGGLDADAVKYIADRSNITTLEDDRLTNVSPYAFYSTDSGSDHKRMKLSKVHLVNCEHVENYAFYNCSYLTDIYFPKLATLASGSGYVSPDYAFAGIGITELSSEQFPVLSNIGSSSAFNGCKQLTNINLPSLTNISGGNAFSSCSNLTTVTLSNLTSIGNQYTFSNDLKLQTVNLPALRYLYGYYTFQGDSSIESITFPELTYAPSGTYLYYTFNNCTKLAEVHLPKLERLTGGSAFQGCTSLTTIDLPELTILAGASYMFGNCTSLTNVVFPKVTSIEPYWSSNFSGCTSLQKIEFPSLQTFGQSCSTTFQGCRSLDTVDLGPCKSIGYSTTFGQNSLRKLILRYNGVVNPSYAATAGNFFLYSCRYHFTGTTDATYNPTGAKDGYIYVPDNQVDAYKASSYWSAWKDQIKGISQLNEATDLDINVLSQDTAAPAQILAAVSAIQSIDFDTTGIEDLEIYNVDYTDISRINFKVRMLTTITSGDFTIPVTIHVSDTETATCTLTIHVVDTLIPTTFTESHGTTYYFTVENENTYKSTNVGSATSPTDKQNTFARSVFTFESNGMQYVYLDCTSDGEYKSDYGLVSKIDVDLAGSNAADADEKLSYSFKNDLPSSTEVKTISFGRMPSGTHTVVVKYIKDAYKNLNTDCMHVTVCCENEPRS